jgi:chromosomal replication initiator protein
MNDTTFPACEDRPVLTLAPAATSAPEAEATARSLTVSEPPSLFGAVNLQARAERMAGIRSTVAQLCGVSVAELQGHDRHATVAWIRMVCCYLCRELVGASWAEIGRFMDRDHATIMHAHRRVTECIALYPRVREEIDTLRQAITV